MNKVSRELIDEVRQRSNIVEIIGTDIELRPSGKVLKGLSPFHPEKDPSFVVWPETQSWYDFSNGGGRGGDVFAYLMERQGLGFKETLHQLAARAGLKPPEENDAQYVCDLAQIAERLEIERILTLAAGYYHQVLPENIRKNLYREHYGFADVTIDRLQLGWADGCLFSHLHARFGLSRSAALKTGLFVRTKDGAALDFFQNRLVFPYWKRGRAVYFIARKTSYTDDKPWEKAKYKKLLTHSEKHPYVSPVVGNDYFYNEDGIRGGEDILVTEGVTDCISAIQAGIPCASPVTTRFRTRDLPKLLSLTQGAKKVIVCNDSEVNGAGEAGALDTAAALSRQGRDVRIATLPRPKGVDKVDLNEFLKVHSVDALREVLAQARRYPEHLLECIPQGVPPDELERRLRPVMDAVARCQPIERDAYVAAISKRFDVKVRVIQELVAGAKQQVSERMRMATRSRPRIVMGSQLRDMLAETWTCIHAKNSPPQLFERTGALVRIAHGRRRPSITTLDEREVIEMLGEVADWVRVTEQSEHNVFPPRDVVRVITACPRDLPSLEAVLAGPVFASSGKLIVDPGYHPEACAWLHLPKGFQVPLVSQNPSAEEVVAARSLLLDDLLVDFPFVDPSDRAHMVALLLLPFARRLIEGVTPIHLVEAPDAGAGKGLLTSLVEILAIGIAASGGSIPDNEEEIRKKITSELATGRPLLVLDNAAEKKRLDSASLASAVTMLVWEDRLLGQNRILELPNQAVWIVTGNNPRVSKELARRCVRIRIDPRVDRPWLRSGFKHPALIRWTHENRGALLHAALTLIQNWIALGRSPWTGDPLGTFEDWSSVMGGILEAAAVPGFLGNLNALYETADTEGAIWREFILAWWTAHQETSVRVADLVKLCTSDDLMEAVVGEGSEKSQSIRLGRALQAARDRVFGEFRVQAATDAHSKRPLYRLTKVAGTGEKRTADAAC